jgi:hypothetical protein
MLLSVGAMKHAEAGEEIFYHLAVGLKSMTTIHSTNAEAIPHLCIQKKKPLIPKQKT